MPRCHRDWNGQFVCTQAASNWGRASGGCSLSCGRAVQHNLTLLNKCSHLMLHCCICLPAAATGVHQHVDEDCRPTRPVVRIRSRIKDACAYSFYQRWQQRWLVTTPKHVHWTEPHRRCWLKVFARLRVAAAAGTNRPSSLEEPDRLNCAVLVVYYRCRQEAVLQWSVECCTKPVSGCPWNGRKRARSH